MYGICLLETACKTIKQPNITVDNQLFLSKTRFRFTQYMLSYLFKNDIDEHSVLRLIQSYTKTERNVTTDNFFTLYSSHSHSSQAQGQQDKSSATASEKTLYKYVQAPPAKLRPFKRKWS